MDCSLKFLMNTIMIYYCCSQTFSLSHFFKRFINSTDITVHFKNVFLATEGVLSYKAWYTKLLFIRRHQSKYIALCTGDCSRSV
jgi:hypothetical protein